MEEGTLIRDFAILIGSAGAFGILFHLLRLPLLLGYIVSGLVIGPHFFFSSYIQNYDTLKQFGELGVIFLMFYVGLEFNLVKLRKAIGPSFIAVALQAMFMIFVGINVAKFLGWSGLNGIFLGSLLSFSSTMVTIPLLRDLKLLNSYPAQLSMGILILEDMAAILVLIVLSGVASTGQFDWPAMMRTGFFVGVFISMVFVIGRLMGSRMARLLKRFSSMELLAVVATGFVLIFGELSNKFHFSVELGAFLAGSVLSQSVIATQIEKATESLRDVFCAMFFVTVGMLIDPIAISSNWVVILVVSVIALFAQIFVCTVGLILAGEQPESAFKGAVYKSQIGEFSFIIASLGLSLGVVDSGLMSLAVGVSVCTITASSILTKNADKLYNRVKKLVPKALSNFGDFYYKLIHVAQIELNKNKLLKDSKGLLGKIIFYLLLSVGLMFVSAYSSYWIQVHPLKLVDRYEQWIILGIWIATAFIVMPIFTGVIKNIDAIIGKILVSVFKEDFSQEQRGDGTFRLVRHVIVSLVTLLFGLIFISTSAQYFPRGYTLVTFVFLLGIQFLFFRKRLAEFNSKFEHLFQETFIAEVQEKDEEYRNALIQKMQEKYPWSVQIKNYSLPKDSLHVGERIRDLKIRQKTGTTIVAISRGGYTSYSPMPETVLFPEDKILLLGESEQLDKAIKLLDEEAKDTLPLNQRVEFAIDNYCVTGTSPLIGQKISDTELRSNYGVNIVGIQRHQEKIVTPEVSTVLEKGDLLILMGSKSAIDKLKESELTVKV